MRAVVTSSPWTEMPAGVTVVAFLLLVILPAVRNGPTSAMGSAAIPFVLFIALSLGVWAFFRRTHKSAAQPA